MGNMPEGLPDPQLAATGMRPSAARHVAENVVKLLDAVSARSAIDVQIAVDQLAYTLNLAGLDQDRLTQMGRAANRAREFLADKPVAEQPASGASALQHYKLAELWAFKAEPGHASARGRLETPENCAAVAQVHATLALSGIEALRALTPGAANLTTEDHRGWKQAAQESPLSRLGAIPAGARYQSDGATMHRHLGERESWSHDHLGGGEAHGHDKTGAQVPVSPPSLTPNGGVSTTWERHIAQADWLTQGTYEVLRNALADAIDFYAPAASREQPGRYELTAGILAEAAKRAGLRV